MTPPPRRYRRPGFTLVELLVVITILGVLVALLVPAIWSAVRTANDARVSGEINTLASALEQFKLKYNDYPPSRIILVESGGYNTSNPPSPFYQGMNYAPNATYQPIGGSALPQVIFGNPDLNYNQLAERSIRTLRKFWPRVALSNGANSPIQGFPDVWYDFNGNGQLDDLPILLQGHECLVFFLGGISNHDRDPDTGMYTLNGVLGFGNLPQNPFRRDTVNRTEPMHEFRADRLVDDDFDGIPGYVDPLGTGDQGRYYAYFSAYGSGGYDPNDVNLDSSITEQNAPAAQNDTRPFRVAYAYPGAPEPNFTRSQLPNPYTTGLPVPTAGSAAAFVSPQSFQIISAGRDRAYGVGGPYDGSASQTRLPGDPFIPEGDRLRDRDNITSFANGTLD